MPAPATVEDLLELIQKSGVADEGRVKAQMKKLAEQGAIPTEPGKLAGLLVRDALLTFFQAEQLLQGKWKRFSIGKYKVLERLGSGGMGQVFLCEHKLMRRRVAVKVLPTAKAEDDASRKRFYREAQAIAAVDHPNIVRAYDIDQDDNLHFLVMEYVDGTNLQDLVKKFGPLDPIRACHYIYGAAVGLQHAHEIGLVHRDIKPGNILLDRTGVVKILDMGLARFFHDDTDNLTKQYDENILGTADYLSPEQAEDSHTVDIRSDIYSMGSTFYFLLTGSQPFPEGSIPQKLIWHRSREPRSIRSLRPEVPEGVAAVVAKMMAKKPQDRHQLPTDVMAALAPWVGTPIPPPHEREMPQLSPAIAGGVTRGSAAPTVVAPWQSGPATLVTASPITVIASGSTAGGETQSPMLTPPPAADGVWESLDHDTQPVSRAETKDRPQRPVPGTAERPALRGAPPRLLLVLVASGVLLLLLVAGVAAYFLFFHKKPEPVEQPGPPGPRRLIVGKAGGENTFPTLAHALREVKPGDTIVLAVSELSEPVLRLDKKKDITIESGLADGRSARITPAPNAGPAAVLDLVNVENVRIRNVEFDGGGRVDVGVLVSGRCPGVTLENVTVRGFKKTGIHLLNVAGESARPVVLDRCRVVVAEGNEAAVTVAATGQLETRRVVIRNGRVEGKGKAAIRFDGALADIEVTGNRLYQPEAGFVFFRVPDGKTLKALLANNTIYGATLGLAFNAEHLKGQLDVFVTRNYFAKTTSITPVGPPPPAPPAPPVAGVTGADNGHDAASNPGATPLGAYLITSPELPTPNPANDADFLRFPSGGPQPEVGPSKVRVGAP